MVSDHTGACVEGMMRSMSEQPDSPNASHRQGCSGAGPACHSIFAHSGASLSDSEEKDLPWVKRR